MINTELSENYYRITVNGHGEFYEWAESATHAAQLIRTEISYDNHRSSERRPIGAITVRPAIYGEWKRNANEYTNGMRNA